MLRLLLTMLLAAALALGAAWYLGLWPLSQENGVSETSSSTSPAPPLPRGAPLYPPASEAVLPAIVRPAGPDPIVLAGCTVIPRHKQEVASLREGKILFIGREVPAPEPGQLTQLGKVVLDLGDQKRVIYYREWDRGQVVQPGEMVAKMDPTLALADLRSLQAKKKAAEAEFRAAEKTFQEAEAKVLRYERALRSGIQQLSREDLEAARLLRDRYREEVANKQEAIHALEADIAKTQAVLAQHDIRNDMAGPGIIKAIYRQRGDTVKPQEPILQLYGIADLRVEGLADVQYRDRLQEGARVSLEPVIPDSPWRTLSGHRGEITGVAFVGRGEGLRLVSASDDHTVAVWRVQAAGGVERLLFHTEAVRAVACVQDAAGRAWCLTGCADGSLWLWDLDGPADRPRWQRREERPGGGRAITALAFSPDGRFFAVGSEDGSISLWCTPQGKLLYSLDAAHGAAEGHEGAVTSLHFTPQCRLVSAARDNTLRIWSLYEQGVAPEPHVVRGRSGLVPALGVSADGSRMLFDKGTRLQVLSVPEGRTLQEVRGTFGSTPFETLALFSPEMTLAPGMEGCLLLTAGAPEGRLQLWWTPRRAAHIYEVRQFVTPEHATATCAAFAPDVSFAASGSKEGLVYLWRLPAPSEIQQHRLEGLRLSQVDRALDANARQVRISIDLANAVDPQHPFGRLLPGRPVTVVIEP
jgi:WD40 repeat protein